MPQKFDLGLINAVLVIALILILIINVGVLYSLTPSAPKVPAKPEIELLFVNVKECESCPDLSTISSAFEKLGLSIKSSKTIFVEDAKDIIIKYGLIKLPSVVITGDVDSLLGKNFRKESDGFIYEPASPPYVNASTNKLVGKVSVIALEDSSCTQCTAAQGIVDQLTQIGVALESRSVEAGTPEGAELTAKYNITKLPTILLSNEALLYQQIEQVWSSAGTTEPDGMLVLRAVPAPYREPATRLIRGLVEVTFLTDVSCKECYNVSIHENILKENFRMQLSSKKTIDIKSNEGKAIAVKYNITYIPTIILSSQASAYDGVSQVWASVGNIASDGSYVFTAIDQLQGQTYKNLKSGMIVRPGNNTKDTA
ncbi:MAG: hypothetical protein Q7K43_00185 [Candidatus Woesearchaeota archaeon]|nr:hypothetical protein [Candidatus Woesearchaeota archaeon]